MPVERTKKRLEQLSLGKRIERLGVEMVSCSRCEKTGKRCVGMRVGPHVGRCAECCRQGKTCDVKERNRMPSDSDWESIDRQRQLLRDEEEEAMAKILRLRKQQRFFG